MKSYPLFCTLIGILIIILILSFINTNSNGFRILREGYTNAATQYADSMSGNTGTGDSISSQAYIQIGGLNSSQNGLTGVTGITGFINYLNTFSSIPTYIQH
jgi:hypothetical protein